MASRKVSTILFSLILGVDIRTVPQSAGNHCVECWVCRVSAMINVHGASISKTLLFEADGVSKGLQQYIEQGITVGSTTALLPESSDALTVNATLVMDGKSGDIEFPHGAIKPIATVGERRVRLESESEKIAGVPDGFGSYLADNHTVCVVVQSESYGPLRHETFKYPGNGGAAHFTGSHVQYVDYDREMMSNFTKSNKPSSEMVVGMGEMIETAYNLKGELISSRNGSDPTMVGAHYGNTDADGKYVAAEIPSEEDWFYQSFCSAHIEQTPVG